MLAMLDSIATSTEDEMASNPVVLDPIAPGNNEPQDLRQALPGIAGKVVGFIDNAKPNFHHLIDDLGELLTRQYGAKEIIKRRKRGASVPAPEAMMKELTERCDLIIAGSGD